MAAEEAMRVKHERVIAGLQERLSVAEEKVRGDCPWYSGSV